MAVRVFLSLQVIMTRTIVHIWPDAYESTPQHAPNNIFNEHILLDTLKTSSICNTDVVQLAYEPEVQSSY